MTTEADPRANLKDPPIFLLQALPTWAPWLPDGGNQRVTVGTTGQVLTVNADGSIGWQNSAAGFTNPMTTTGDLITSNPGATPVRLGIGTANQVLTVVGGVPTWQNNVGFSNPLTTTGDMLYSNPGSTLVRLGIGTTNQVLTVVGGVPTWQNAATGFTNPMTTLGDVITAATGGAAQRLGVGANNQVLTVVGGVPAWANSASGFANPMTATGDMIISDPGSTPVRLPLGAPGSVLTVSGGIPTWVAGIQSAYVVVSPSQDTSGVTDQQAISAAISQLTPGGGVILLTQGFFYVKPASGNICINLPQDTVVAPQGSSFKGSPVSIMGCGAATVVYPIGAGKTCLYMHRTTSYGGQFGLPAQPMTGFARDFTIDGSLATGASIGLDWGDGWGYHFDLNVVNFTGTGAIGVRQINMTFWTEKNGPIVLRLSNNTTAYYATTNLAPGGDHSSEYNTYHITEFCAENQQGFVVDGVNMGGSHIWLQGNMANSSTTTGSAPTGNIAALSIINAAGVVASDGFRWYQGTIQLKVEANQGNGPPSGNSPYDYYSDGNGYIKQCSGIICGSSLTNGKTNGSEFGFGGLITQDPNLATAWPSTSFPGLGNPWNNTGPNASVCIAGGTISSVTINGNSCGAGVTSGTFYVPAGGVLQVNGTVAPTTFNIVPAAQSSQ